MATQQPRTYVTRMANVRRFRDTLPHGFIASDGAHISATISGKAWAITSQGHGVYQARCEDGREFSHTLPEIIARLLDLRADGR